MKSEQLFVLLGDVDETFVEAARGRKKTHRKGWISFGAVAACLCLVCVGTFCQPEGETIGPPIPDPDGSIIREERPGEIPPVHIVPSQEALTEPKELTSELYWMSAEQIEKLEDDSLQMGLYVPAFVTYEGGFYHGIELEEDELFAPSGKELKFNADYSGKIYSVLDKPDCIAVLINGMEVYQKAFDVTFEMDGLIYAIAYSPNLGTEYERGAAVYDGMDFTVYEAVRLGEAAAEEKEYLVNILPLLRDRWPGIFGDDQNYADAWQLALPLAEVVTDHPAQENPVAAGTLSPYEEVWGGSYTDASGKMYILLTEDTQENREMVFGRNPGLNEENTVFLQAEYTQAYLDELMVQVSKLMAAGELPSVTSAARLDTRNRVRITMRENDPGSVALVRNLDTLGGAVEFVVSEQSASHELGLVMVDKTA